MKGTSILTTVCGIIWCLVGGELEPSHVRADDHPVKKMKTLEKTERSVLFPALHNFVSSPGTKLDLNFVTLESADNTIRFSQIPKGWFTWKDALRKNQKIVSDQHGFRTIISMYQVHNLKESLANNIHCGHGPDHIVLLDRLFLGNTYEAPRVVTCAALLGGTNFFEYRYFVTDKGRVICVELNVFDFPGEDQTLEDLLQHLKKNYGKYQGTCDSLLNFICKRRKGGRD